MKYTRGGNDCDSGDVVGVSFSGGFDVIVVILVDVVVTVVVHNEQKNDSC